MVARVITDPKAFLDDPTAVYDYDDPKIKQLAETRPWLDWPQPSYPHSLSWPDWPDKGMQVEYLDGSKCEFMNLNHRNEAGDSRIGKSRQFRLVTDYEPFGLPGYSDLFYHLDGPDWLCTEKAKLAIESLPNHGCEFFPIEVTNSAGRHWDVKVYAFHTRNRCHLASFRAPGYYVYTKSRYVIGSSEFAEYHDVCDYPFFMFSKKMTSGLFTTAAFRDAMDARGVAYTLSELEAGWAFPDGTGYHPTLWPSWPPEPLPLPAEFHYKTDGQREEAKQRTMVKPDSAPDCLLEEIARCYR